MRSEPAQSSIETIVLKISSGLSRMPQSVNSATCNKVLPDSDVDKVSQRQQEMAWERCKSLYDLRVPIRHPAAWQVRWCSGAVHRHYRVTAEASSKRMERYRKAVELGHCLMEVDRSHSEVCSYELSEKVW